MKKKLSKKMSFFAFRKSHTQKVRCNMRLCKMADCQVCSKKRDDQRKLNDLYWGIGRFFFFLKEQKSEVISILHDKFMGAKSLSKEYDLLCCLVS